MRIITALLVLGCIVSVAPGQWVETTIPLPDSLSGLDGISAMLFHSPNGTIYVGRDSTLIAIDARTYRKLAKVPFPGSLGIMCSSTSSNKVYCASNSYYTNYISVIDGATNRFLTTVPLDSSARDMCYAAASNKLYVACPQAVYVIDCETDSVTATIGPLSRPSALCYNPALNRIYSTQSGSDEVAVIDCATDSVIRTIWLRGIRPLDVCFDSTTNCVYTANYTSGTVSVIDCAGDSLVRIVATGNEPEMLVAGPEGKVYCGGYYDSVLTVVATGGTRTIPVGRSLRYLSYDPTNRKVYCATEYDSLLAVIDATGDTVAARVGVGVGLHLLCYDPVGNSTLAASMDESTVGVIDGATNRLSDSLGLGVFHPGALSYNPVNNHLYCLEAGWNHDGNHLMVIDGDSHRVLKVLPAGSTADSMVWNPVSNKIYFSNSGDNTVSIVDCASDSIIATVEIASDWPEAMCCSEDGKVYVVSHGGGVTVIDGLGDTVRTVVPVNDNSRTLCYDRTDNKVYVGRWDGGPVSVIDANTDSVVAAVSVVQGRQIVCWNQNHDKVYVCSHNSDSVTVVDCASDTVLGNILVTTGLSIAYSDSISDKVYFADDIRGNLRVINAGTDSFYKSVVVGSVGAMVDNGRTGSEHRLYSAAFPAGRVDVVDGTTDNILRRIQVGEDPSALAWNPAHSWVYVSNSAGSSITVLRDTLAVGIEENQPQASSNKLQATVVRGVLFLNGDCPGTGSIVKAVLLDVSGRKVLDLQAGANDVSRLSPGVYFVREAQAQAQAQVVRKVILTR